VQGAGSPFGRPTECRRPHGCSEPLVQSSARDSAARPLAQQLRAGRGRVGESVEVTSAELLSLVYISSACKLFLKTFQHVLGLSGARVGRACNSVGFPLAGIDHSPSLSPSLLFTLLAALSCSKPVADYADCVWNLPLSNMADNGFRAPSCFAAKHVASHCEPCQTTANNLIQSQVHNMTKDP